MFRLGLSLVWLIVLFEKKNTVGEKTCRGKYLGGKRPSGEKTGGEMT